jgi:Ca2+:H+ antiporter
MTGSTQLNSSLLTISVIAVLLPAAFHFAAGAEIPDPQEENDILAVSHAVSDCDLHGISKWLG